MFSRPMTTSPFRASSRSRASTGIAGPCRFFLALSCVIASTLGVATSASAAEVHGIELMPRAKELSAGRYESPRDYEHTLKFFRDKFRGWKDVRTFREVSLPTVKYVHIQNNSTNAAWSGINIYQLRSGQVRVYVLPSVPTTAAPKKP